MIKELFHLCESSEINVGSIYSEMAIFEPASTIVMFRQ